MLSGSLYRRGAGPHSRCDGRRLVQINQLRLDNNHIHDTGATALFNMLTTTATLPELHVCTMHNNLLSDSMYAKLFDGGRVNPGVVVDFNWDLFEPYY